MRRVYFLGLLTIMAVSWWGCSRLQTTNRYPTDAGVIGPNAEVILFYKDGKSIVVQQCEDLTDLHSRDDCKLKLGTAAQRVSLSDFKDSLKRTLKFPGGDYHGDIERKIKIYNDLPDSNSIKDLGRRRDELKEHIADIEVFIHTFGKENAGTYNDQLANLKERLSQVEAKLEENAQVGQIVAEINGEIDRLVDDIISSESWEIYTYSDHKTGFIFNILRAYFKVSGVALSFQRIEGGSFTMGSPPGEAGRHNDENGKDGEQVEVTISKSFEITTTEVTQSQWFNVMEDNPSHFKRPQDCVDHRAIGKGLCPNNPVESVSWNDIQRYIKKLNAANGISGCHGTPEDKSGCYRLPTEAEWEFAARGGATSAYSFSEGILGDILGDYAWYSRNSGTQTHPVGKLKPNPYGLFDMHGNVWEWVQDKYHRQLPGGTDPLHSSSESVRVIRGGSWYNGAQDLRCAYRSWDLPGYGFSFVGLRLVRTL